MAHSAPAGGRHPELATLVREAAAGRPKSVYLFWGESFETAAAAHALLEVLVPSSRQAFNLETYDGRTTRMSTVLDSLRMPGFFSGTKLIWVRETTVFLSGEKRGELTKALWAAWNDGREREAAEKLLTLVAMAGWSQEQWRETRWSALAKTRIYDVFGVEVDAEALAQLETLQAICGARDLSVSAYRDDSGDLLDFLAAGTPPHTVLLLTTSTVDARKRLYKRVRELGAVVDLNASRERSGTLSRGSVDALLNDVLDEFGKRMPPVAREIVARRAGSDMASVAAEVEKLCLYAGDRRSITEDDVRLVFRDMAESWIFDFTAALTARQLARALPLLRSLFAQGEPALRLLAMIAREVRLLLVARECLDDSLRGTWRPDLSFNVFQSRVLPKLDPVTMEAFGKAHPFVLYRRFQDAGRMELRTLRRALVKLSDLDVRLKSGRADPGILFEAFVIDWCRGSSRSARRHGDVRV
jgi:DNA polymerase-3 subunit delta